MPRLVSKPADSWTGQGCLLPLQLMLFWYCLDDFHNIAHLIATATYNISFCFILFSHQAKNPRMLHATQPVEKKQQGCRREGRRKQTGGEQSSTSLLSALILLGFGRVRGEHGKKAGGEARCSLGLALPGPALCQKISPFLPCGNGVRSPHPWWSQLTWNASALFLLLSSSSSSSPSLQAWKKWHRDHSVVFIRRNSSLSTKILHRESVVDF